MGRSFRLDEHHVQFEQAGSAPSMKLGFGKGGEDPDADVEPWTLFKTPATARGRRYNGNS